MLNSARLLTLVLMLAGMALALPAGVAASTRAPGAIDPAAPNLTAEEQLALRYAPIAYLKTQTAPCDAKGEPYAPAPVEVVLGDSLVVLRARSAAKKSSGDPIVKTAPTAADLAGKNGDYYLDLPGNPLHGGCTYEQFFHARMGDQQPMVYARIATETGVGGFALQYWFYYVFNRFNNLHESDWEMIQLEFHDKTVQEALAPGAEPDEVAFAQHGGGETADWNSEKLQKEGDRPVVYPASGSHAAYYGNFLYLGWGERGSGLGCDDSSGPSARVPLDVSLMPDNPTAAGPFSWLTFTGRWGERQPWEFNGPTGPETKSQWTAPFSWENRLRKSSLPLLSSSTIGPNPTSLFCGAVSLGANYIVFRDGHISAADLMLIVVALIPIALLALARRTLAATLSLFVRHGAIFLALGGVLFVIGTLDNVGQSLIQRVPFINDILGILNIPLNQGLFVVSGSGVQQLAGWLLVTPAVVYSVLEIQMGRRPTFRRAYRFAVSKAAPVIKASLMSAAIVIALAISIVGIPWAVARLVRWMLVVQAIVLDESNWREAREFSARAVRGRWWRTAVIAAALTILNSLLAPIIGIVVLIFVTPSAFTAQTVSSVVYALLFPMVGIATTLWYQQRKPPAVMRTRSSVFPSS